MIKVEKTSLDDVLVIHTRKFVDNRGFFAEIYNREDFVENGITDVFVQDNHSYSKTSGVLRGLHFQLPPHAQSKLIRVTRGSVFDVAVDIRKGSPTFLKWVGLELSTDNCLQLYIPSGFAHGYVTLEDDTELLYKVSEFYAPDCERTINYKDPTIGIQWTINSDHLILSEKDQIARPIGEVDLFNYQRMPK